MAADGDGIGGFIIGESPIGGYPVPAIPYVDVITSEHRVRVNFVATVLVCVKPYMDGIALLESLPASFDLDSASGAQLDVIGEWVGQSRYLTTPLPNTYFSWDISGQGWDEGTWKGPFDPVTGLTILPDDTYRVLLKAVIAANKWDGTTPGAYAAWAILFAALGGTLKIRDNQDMTMSLAYFGATRPNAVVTALITGGYIELKPSGVEIEGYYFNGFIDPL